MNLENAMNLLGEYMEQANIRGVTAILPPHPECDLEAVGPVIYHWTPNEKVVIMANCILRNLPETREYQALKIQLRYIRDLAMYVD
jgi:hypothetical protein